MVKLLLVQYIALNRLEHASTWALFIMVFGVDIQWVFY